MRRDPGTLQQTEFDLAVIGGGITGACIAHDAALRGLQVALVERGDFGSATSAASSKLLHGGIRYLQHAQLGKVRESAQERAHFQTIAPHLTRFVPFVIPTYDNFARGSLFLRTGVAMYGLLVRTTQREIDDPAKRTPPERFLERAELVRLAPEIAANPDIRGAQLLHESHIYNSERMTLAFIKTAARNGAVVCNYAPAIDFLSESNRIKGVRIWDELTGRPVDVRARVVANASGPWIARLNERLSFRELGRSVVDFGKGAHIVTRQLTGEHAVVLSTKRRIRSIINRGGRHIFVIPWRNHSLIGTTNTPFRGDLDDVRVSDEDVADLIADVNAALPGVALGTRDVVYAFAGLYPLTDTSAQNVYQVSGTYRVVDHAKASRVDGLISVLGARYTTARRVAERAVDLTFRKLGRPVPPCRTAVSPLVGGSIQDLLRFRTDATRTLDGRVDRDVIDHLVSAYGDELEDLVSTEDEGLPLLARLSTARESIEAEVAFAVDREMAVRLDDVVLRRTGLGTLGYPGRRCLDRAAAIMAARLNWSEHQVAEECARTLDHYRRLPLSLHPHD